MNTLLFSQQNSSANHLSSLITHPLLQPYSGSSLSHHSYSAWSMRPKVVPNPPKFPFSHGWFDCACDLTSHGLNRLLKFHEKVTHLIRGDVRRSPETSCISPSSKPPYNNRKFRGPKNVRDHMAYITADPILQIESWIMHSLLTLLEIAPDFARYVAWPSTWATSSVMSGQVTQLGLEANPLLTLFTFVIKAIWRANHKKVLIVCDTLLAVQRSIYHDE